MNRTILSTVIISLFFGAQAGAQETSDGRWHYQLTPYVWMSGLSGDVSPSFLGPTFSVDKSFGDILDTLDAAFFVTAFARKDRFVLLADLNYVSTSERDSTPVPFVSVRAEVEQISGTLAAGVRAVDEAAGSIDILAGARAWHVDAEVAAEGDLPPLPIGFQTSVSDTWSFVDPIIAVRGRLALTEKLSILAYGDIGGFGVGSDFTWQALATLNYAVTERFYVSAGYRHLSVDYQDGGQVLDIELSGPLVGATWRF